jgi:hypothetical protein
MITTLDGLINALKNNGSAAVIDRASLANQTAGQYASLWRATGIPGQSAIPGTTPSIPTNAAAGAIPFTNQTAPARAYLAWASLASSLSAMTIEFVDRVAHMGGLVLNVSPAAQTITGLDLSTLGLAADRRGPANYSEISWALETYTDGGATASNATINVTYDDASTGNLNVLAVGGTLRASRLLPLTPLIPTAQQGKFIRGVNSVTLSASTGTAGNFGFTAMRPLAALTLPLANKAEVADWAQLGAPWVPNDACLVMRALCSTTSTGTLRGLLRVIYG